MKCRFPELICTKRVFLTLRNINFSRACPEEAADVLETKDKDKDDSNESEV